MLCFFLCGNVFAFSEVPMTPDEAKDFAANYKPIATTKDAVPWRIFIETKALETCSVRGTLDYCVNKPIYGKNIQKLDNKEVILMGFMFPLEQTETQKNFLFGAYPLSCPYHYHVGPEQVVEVKAQKGIPFSYQPVKLKGILKLDFNEETEVFYYLENAVVME